MVTAVSITCVHFRLNLKEIDVDLRDFNILLHDFSTVAIRSHFFHR